MKKLIAERFAKKRMDLKLGNVDVLEYLGPEAYFTSSMISSLAEYKIS
jgi:hypothetical protein